MNFWVYLFEARSLRNFVLEDGQAADCLDHLDRLCHEPFDALLDVLGLSGDVAVLDRGGAVLRVLCTHAEGETRVRNIRDLWGLLVHAHFSELEFADALGGAATYPAALAAARQALRRAESRPRAIFPERPPIARRASGHGETVPRALVRRWFGQPDAGMECGPWDTLAYQYGPLPVCRMAIIHAEADATPPDLEDAGQLRQFHLTLEQAFHAAVHGAHAEIPALAQPLLPAEGRCLFRPLRLGSRHFTLLVRADLALAHTAAVLSGFERQDAATPPCERTAHAGIAYFTDPADCVAATELAASLCAQAGAENAGGIEPSCFAFSRLPDAVRPAGNLPERVAIYGLGRHAGGLPSWEPLHALAALLAGEDMAFGPSRRLSALLREENDADCRGYLHWREGLARTMPYRLRKIDEQLAVFGIRRNAPPWFECRGRMVSPLADALLLYHAGHAAERSEQRAIA